MVRGSASLASLASHHNTGIRASVLLAVTPAYPAHTHVRA